MDYDPDVRRRQFLRVGAAGAGASALPAGTALGQDDAKASIAVEDQESDGESVLVAHVSTSVDASLFVLNEAGDTVGGSGVTFDAGAEASDVEVTLDSPLQDTQTVTVMLLESNAGQIAEDDALVTVTGDPDSAPETTLSIEDQESDGSTVVIDEVSTTVDASLFVLNEAGDTIGGSGVTFDAGTTEEGLEVALDDPLQETQTVTGLLFESNGGVIASDDALVTVEGETGPAPDATVSIEDQESDGSTVVIDEVTTNVDASVFVLNEAGDTIGGSGVTFDAGDDERDVEVSLDEPITESQVVTVLLFQSNGGVIAEDEAVVSVGDDVETVDGVDLTLVPADPEAGFHYPYFLYAPSGVDPGEVPVLVEPNNTGTSTDEFAAHRDAAERQAEGGVGRTVSDELTVPLLVPVFPRPRSQPVDWTHYVHQLDRDTLAIDGGDLERVDLQLLAMVEHASEALEEAGYTIRDEIALNGFSASGNFVDRFAVLHPERVGSVTAGGLNGMAQLPLARAEGHTLPFHVGIADVHELTGSPVDLDALDDVDQFLYMGSEDESDTIPYDDAWTDDELREIALDVYGEDMIADRFPTSQAAYEIAGVDAQFRVYDGVGHTPRPAVEDVVEFHRRSIAGEDVSDLGEALPDVELDVTPPQTPDAAITVSPARALTVIETTFDGRASESAGDEVVSYEWTFGDGETASGAVVEHSFDDAGTYEVALQIVDDTGGSDEVVLELPVDEPGGGRGERRRRRRERDRRSRDRSRPSRDRNRSNGDRSR